MLRITVCLAAALLVAGSLQTASAQSTTAPAAAPAATTAKPGRVKLTVQKLKEMQAKWKTNKPKLKACRKEVKAKGLVDDDRWFYIADCMEKS